MTEVYGFYIRRGERPDKSEPRKYDEEVVVDSESVNRPITELNLTPEAVVVVDISGIVHKANKKSDTD
ncbi:unnamed protein product [Gongylonema pulchrum]|uniref:SHSP domain-containing protein n=1 Tax=Gongylonema pulchrum TaxID=637853 RepID=A0A183DH71_9BILA|nr:unnamed protein product [Gongylonema pulchrum]